MLPSLLGNKKKRLVAKNIEGKSGARFSSYCDEFGYLTNAGIALEVKAISAPVFPLIESSGKKLLKLYLNDVGILTALLYQHNARAVLEDVASINLGAVYECVVAMELKAHGHELFYYDNKSRGEVDYLIDDYENLAVLPLEVKSGKDYTVHSALTSFTANDYYGILRAFVLSNERNVTKKGKIFYIPVYFSMFL